MPITYEKNGENGDLVDEVNQINASRKVINTFDRQGLERLKTQLSKEIERHNLDISNLEGRIVNIEEVLK